jgi:hypothetical protein
MDETTDVLGWASTPKSPTGLLSPIVSELAPFVHNTRGVALSTSGGEPQLPHVVGVVSATSGESNDTVNPPNESELTVSKSAPGTGKSVVPPT